MKQNIVKTQSPLFLAAACLLILAASTVSIAQSSSTYNLAAELNAAAAEGDIQAAKRILDEGMNVNYKRSDQTALHFATLFKRAEMVKFLLDRGADPNITDGDGLNALQLAQKGGNAEVVRAIREAMNPRGPIGDDKVEKKNAEPRQRKDVSPPSSLTSREDLGRYKAGDVVLHSRDRGKTWERGTVLKADAELQKYLVENEAKTVRNYYDGVYLTTLQRQPYWTSFFIGDWNLTVPMTATERMKNDDVYLVFAGGQRLPPLRMNGDGTYIWAINKDIVVRGRWQPNESSPGLTLLKGDRGEDWIVYNTSDASERENFKTNTIRLVSRSGNYTPKHGFQIQKK